ncbi:hypothetical protein [Nibribacter koreensis]|uniref:hypothetical protein n=1 Tax=Nibribacter koreensis TaxID=1084519 RepID=UPI0031EC0233
MTQKRGGVSYDNVCGTTPDHRTRNYIEDSFEDASGRRWRRFFSEMNVKADDSQGMGEVVKITQIWKIARVDSLGNIIPGTERVESQTTSEVDLTTFTQFFGMPVTMFQNNGFVRGWMGFDSAPFFDGNTGQVKAYTEEEQNAPPTFTYGKPPVVETPETPTEPDADTPNP